MLDLDLELVSTKKQRSVSRLRSKIKSGAYICMLRSTGHKIHVVHIRGLSKWKYDSSSRLSRWQYDPSTVHTSNISLSLHGCSQIWIRKLWSERMDQHPDPKTSRCYTHGFKSGPGFLLDQKKISFIPIFLPDQKTLDIQTNIL